MTSSPKSEEQALKIYNEGIRTATAWHKRLAEGSQPLPFKSGRAFADEDPARKEQSPLGGKIW